MMAQRFFDLENVGGANRARYARLLLAMTAVLVGACGDDGSTAVVDLGPATDLARADMGGELTGCAAPNACTPGEERRSAEGCDSGDRLVRCDTACVFQSASACEVSSCETPGATEEVACGRCGTGTRFCTAAGVWELGACSGEGECAAGTTQMGTCGKCGMQQQRCNTECQWDGSEPCTGEGECRPGEVIATAMMCPDGRSSTRSCDDTCVFGAPECVMLPGEGDACPGGECSENLVCSQLSPLPLCRRPCSSDANCSGRECFLDDAVCSDACELFTNAGCPPGSKCQFLYNTAFFPGGPGEEARACFPVGTGAPGEFCRVHHDCAADYGCVTDSAGVGACIAVCDDDHPCAEGACSATSGAGYCPR